MEEFSQIFVDEASEHIAKLEEAVLKLENDKNNHELIDQIFRVMHSLKGAAGMFGFEKIGEYTHGLEDIYENIRTGKTEITEELIDITFDSVDHLRNLLANPELSDKKIQIRHYDLIKIIKTIKGNIGAEENIKNIQEKIIVKNEFNNNNNASYYIYFKPHSEILNEGIDPLLIISDLSKFGESKVFKNIDYVEDLRLLDVTKCYTCWHIFLSTNSSVNEIKDHFIFVESKSELKISKICSFNIFKKNGIIEKLESVIKSAKNKDIDIEREIINAISLNGKRDFSNTEKNKKNRENTKSTIKVSSEKLDELMNLVSELVTAQAELGVLSNLHNIQKLTTVAENIEKISRSLRDNALNICLVPIEEMIFQFKRLVRDLSNELNKEIEFQTEGTDTELDKRLIENLKEPFMHIFRNAIDHGIESSDERISKGKKSTGTIKLKAYYSGAEVHIQIIDDGNGMDPERIREKAIQKKLIKKEDELSKKEILELIFQPGFSTAEVITDVSGRGVGMDVVKRKINEINGIVEVESEINEGTTITIKLPLSLSIIDALLVKIDKTPFLLPLSFVDKCDEASTDQIINSVNNRIKIDDELIPLIYLRKEFEIDKNCPEMHRLIIIKYDGKKIALVVDSIVGEHQAVLKPLGEVECKKEIITSACILGDGSVALVMDTNKLVEYYGKRKEKRENNYYEKLKFKL
ncbi:MAG: chemotaxis protein CheA [Bacteroidota bacterium]|nr:chemotaxis protein CheA [Bacteroidota bacterium]